MIINIIGQPGSGKTTLANELKKSLNNHLPVIIDGDELRKAVNNKDYSDIGRRDNMKLAYNIALFMEKQGFIPIIALVSPYDDMRQWLKIQAGQVIQVKLSCSKERGRESYFAKDWEDPANPDEWYHFNTGIMEPKLICDTILKHANLI